MKDLGPAGGDCRASGQELAAEPATRRLASCHPLVRTVRHPRRRVFDYGSLPVDRRLIDDDITGSLAWAEALGRAGVLTAR